MVTLVTNRLDGPSAPLTAPTPARRFVVRWIPIREADRFIARHHRHHDPAQGGIVAMGIFEGDDLAGVGVIGRPVSRKLQEAGVCERDGLARNGDHANCAVCPPGANLKCQRPDCPRRDYRTMGQRLRDGTT